MTKTKSIVKYSCSDCGGTEWELLIERLTNGRTHLLTVCSNKQCIQSKKLKLGLPLDDESQLVVWDEFDITGCGYDEEDDEDLEYEPKMVN
jgi:hypothetical protein